ncbi:DNA repair and recombination protein, partial [Colletotrichum musicola]
LVVTATSGTAAAVIGGTTIHSAVGLKRDIDGASGDSVVPGNLETAKQRWRRRDVLIIDEASMLGLFTLYEVDQRLRMLRGFQEKPFGGIPVVVLTGDVLQFSPVNQNSLLSNISRITTAAVNKRGGRKGGRQGMEGEGGKEALGVIH